MRYLWSIVFSLCLCTGLKGQQQREWGKWESWGDQGDGTYMNPVIPSDYSDIDCIRVGDDYYAISSTFQFSPGMTILHSKDLVNWEICGNAVEDLTQIGEELDWTRMNRYNRGIWAGTLRYHDGRFYLFFGTPDEGYFMTSAVRPEGPWEPLTSLLSEPGWDDCTAIWDDKGKAYFVGTHFADGYKTYLFKMSEDGKSIDRKSAVLINEGSGREASKLIKVNGWYYLVFSEHKPGVGRYVLAKRSKKVTGPYKEERQLALPSVEAMEPNQGGIVQGRDNNWYFLTHHGTGDWSGRIVSLLPVTWIDGWPMLGDEDGRVPETMEVPVKGGPVIPLVVGDEFDGDKLKMEWQWNHNPVDEAWTLKEHKGFLRLKTNKVVSNLYEARNTLTQRMEGPECSGSLALEVGGMKDGDRAGLAAFNGHSGILTVEKEGKDLFLVMSEEVVSLTDKEKKVNGVERKECARVKLPRTKKVYLRVDADFRLKRDIAEFYYSMDGKDWTKIGSDFRMLFDYRKLFMGTKFGIFNYATKSAGGYVDVDYFRYEKAEK